MLKNIKMKNTRLNILLILLIPLWMQAKMPEGKYKKIKTVHKSYQVEAQESILIDNSYGNIQISTWDKNTVDILASISADGNDQNNVNNRLRSIQVDIKKNNRAIEAITQIGNMHSSWNFWSKIFGSDNNVNFKINYEVHIPAGINVQINNNYGNVFVDRLEGKLELNLDYGKFEIGELLHDNNRITTDYLSSSTIDFIKSGIFHSDYSKIHIQTAYELELKCDYSRIEIDRVRRLKFENDGGSIHVDDVKEVNGSGDYQNRYFANVSYLNFKGDYGSLKIENLLPGFESIKLQCDYTNIRIENLRQAAYRLNIRQEYGCFKQNGLNIYKEINNNGDKIIEGYYRNRNAGSFIKITEDYGCIKIYN